jgi:hypothetical protein
MENEMENFEQKDMLTRSKSAQDAIELIATRSLMA